MDPASKVPLQEQWQSLQAAEEQLYQSLAAWLEAEHADLLKEITDRIDDKITAEMIARTIDRGLFMEPGDAWKDDVRRRLYATAFGFCA